jgi:hypothetical protein
MSPVARLLPLATLSCLLVLAATEAHCAEYPPGEPKAGRTAAAEPKLSPAVPPLKPAERVRVLLVAIAALIIYGVLVRLGKDETNECWIWWVLGALAAGVVFAERLTWWPAILWLAPTLIVLLLGSWILMDVLEAIVEGITESLCASLRGPTIGCGALCFLAGLALTVVCGWEFLGSLHEWLGAGFNENMPAVARANVAMGSVFTVLSLLLLVIGALVFAKARDYGTPAAEPAPDEPVISRPGPNPPVSRGEKCPVCGYLFRPGREVHCDECGRKVHSACLSQGRSGVCRLCTGETEESRWSPEFEETVGDGNVCASCGEGFEGKRRSRCGRCGRWVHRSCLTQEQVDAGRICERCASGEEVLDDDDGTSTARGGGDGVTLPRDDEVRQLTLRAMVAYAARCARRVLPEADPEGPAFAETVADAVRAAERFAAGDEELEVREAEEAANEAAAAAEQFSAGGEPDMGQYSAACAASYAARAAAACAFSQDPAGGMDFGFMADAVAAMGGVAAADAAVGNITAAADAALAAAMGAVSSKTELDDPPARAAEAAFIARALADYNLLLAHKCESFGQLGDAVDPGPYGPLGEL